MPKLTATFSSSFVLQFLPLADKGELVRKFSGETLTEAASFMCL